MTETRQRILETAARLFAERGYELVGVNELIEKSGVAKATFYQHFKSKEILCLEWLRELAQENERDSLELLESPISPQEKIVRKFEIVGTHLKSSAFRGCPFSNTAAVMIEGNSAVRVLVQQYKSTARLFWQSLALQVRREPGSAKALGDAWFLLYSGAVTEAQNSKALWPVDSAKAAALALCKQSS